MDAIIFWDDVIRILSPLLILIAHPLYKNLACLLAVHLCVFSVFHRILVLTGWIDYANPWYFWLYGIWSWIAIIWLTGLCLTTLKRKNFVFESFIVLSCCQIYALSVYGEDVLQTDRESPQYPLYDRYSEVILVLGWYQLTLIIRMGQIGSFFKFLLQSPLASIRLFIRPVFNFIHNLALFRFHSVRKQDKR